MRVLVAGGAGFIGSHVCAELLVRGHDVVSVDNLVTGNADRMHELDASRRFVFVREDVTRTPLLQVDVVLHLASPASPADRAQFPIETMLANSAGTHRLLALAADRGARFVFGSTSGIYGEPLEQPQRETYRGNVDPVGDSACYDESKRFGEALTFEYRRKHGVNASIVRIFDTYGDGMSLRDGRALPALINAALDRRALPIFGDGEQTRSLCHVSDVVDALLLVTLDHAADGQVFNVGDPHEVTTNDLARAVAAAAGIPARLEHMAALADEPARLSPDIGRMIRRYDWEPRVELPDGLRETIAHFADERADRPVAEVA